MTYEQRAWVFLAFVVALALALASVGGVLMGG